MMYFCRVLLSLAWCDVSIWFILVSSRLVACLGIVSLRFLAVCGEKKQKRNRFWDETQQQRLRAWFGLDGHLFTRRNRLENGICTPINAL